MDFLYTILNAIADPVFIKNRDHKWVFLNNACCKFIGLPIEDLLGRSDRDIFPRHQADVFWAMDEAVFSSGRENVNEEELTDTEGATHFIITKKTRYVTADGSVLLVGIINDITERKQNEALLIGQTKKDQLFSAVAESVPGFVFTIRVGTDGHTSFPYASSGIEAVCGLRPEDIRDDAQVLRSRYHPDDRLRLLALMKETERTLAPFRIEIRIANREKIYCWVEIRSQPKRQPDGSTEWHGIMLDITERKNAQDRMELLERSIDMSTDAIFLNNEQMRFTYVNDAACRSLGYSREELLTMTPADIDPNLTLEQVGKKHKTLNPGDSFTLESFHRAKDGRTYPVEIIVNIFMEAGEKFGLTVVRDITARKKIENELRIAACVFESSEGMVVTDSDTVVLKVNQAFTNITGYKPEEIIGKKPSVLSSGYHDGEFYAAMWKSINETGTWEGEIWNLRKNGGVFPERLIISTVKDSKNEVTNYVGSFSDISIFKATEKEIRDLAFFDQLTKLPNRRLLLDRLQQAIASSARSGKIGALLMIDLDNFKSINDTLGHDRGDLLLQQVAHRLQSSVREGDTVARLGGDEFVVMLEGLNEHPLEAAAQTEIVCAKILEALRHTYLLVTHEYHNTPSIGVTLFGNNKHQADDILKQADIAMYKSKYIGRNTVSFFDNKMQEDINFRTALESELRRSLEKHQLQLHYQLQVDDSSHPLGVEALIRWHHPEYGLVAPNHFIPLAEETGIILPIGHWVLETACSQIATWRQSARTRDLVMSVNVSPKQFRQSDFVCQIKDLVRRYDIHPGQLKLELTESLLLENITDTIEIMNSLKELGVSFSLDDFGTGYSSLQYLKSLPLDQLKIDQSFVRDITYDDSDRTIVRTIIMMAHSLNLDVIAEGVETEEQRQILLKMGCKEFQGYLFAEPEPIEKVENMLELHRQRAPREKADG